MKNLLRSQFLTSDHKLWLDEAKLSGVTEVIETSEAEARGLRAEWDAKQTNLRTAIEKVDEEIASVTVESKCFKERLLFKEKALQRITQESDGLEVCETGSSEKAKELSELLTKMSSRKDRENDDLRRNTEFESNHALFDNGKEPNMLHKVIVVMNNNATESETGNSKAPTEEAWKVVKDEMILNAWPREPIAKLLTLTEEERDLATLLVESIILDEAHFIKDRHCSTARVVFALHSLYKWALSGTPLRNHVGELYSLVRFIQIDSYAFYLCKDYNCKVLDYGYTKDCPNCPHSTVRHFFWWNRYISKPIKESVYDRENSKRAMILLKKKVLSSILLRRTKLGRASDLSLPPRIVTLRRDSLDKKEEEFYEALYPQSLLQFGTYAEAGTLMNNYAHIFDLLTRLRQAVDHPYLVVYSSSVEVSASDTNKSDCGICHDPTEDLVVTSCNHSFCKACLVEYSAASGDVLCPTCAKPLTVDLTTSCNSGGNTSASSTRGCKSSRILQRVDKDDFKTSTKIDALKEEIRNMIEGDGYAKGIVFSQFTSFLDLINFSLQQCGIRCVQLVGSMSLPERETARQYEAISSEEQSNKSVMVAISVLLHSTIVSPASIELGGYDIACRFPQLKSFIEMLSFNERDSAVENGSGSEFVEHAIVVRLMVDIQAQVMDGIEDEERFLRSLELLRTSSIKLKEEIGKFDAAVNDVFDVVIRGRNGVAVEGKSRTSTLCELGFPPKPGW